MLSIRPTIRALNMSNFKIPILRTISIGKPNDDQDKLKEEFPSYKPIRELKILSNIPNSPGEKEE